MTAQPTRRGFLAACSAAAAALGLTAGAKRPPIATKGLTPEDLRVIEAAKAELKPLGISVNSNGSGYTSPPTVNFSGGGCYMVKGRLVDAYGRERKTDGTGG